MKPNLMTFAFAALLISSAQAQQATSASSLRTQLNEKLKSSSSKFQLKNAKNFEVDKSSQSSYGMNTKISTQQLQQTQAQLGTNSGGGGYRTFAMQRAIREMARDMVTDIEFSGSPYLTKENKKIVLQALRNIQFLPLVYRQRNGDEVILDYDKSSNQISFLKGFFQIYPEPTDMSSVRHLLMHEIGHLIGLLDDESAEDFATNFDARQSIKLVYNSRDICGSLWQAAPHIDSQAEAQFTKTFSGICRNGKVNIAELRFMNDNLNKGPVYTCEVIKAGIKYLELSVAGTQAAYHLNFIALQDMEPVSCLDDKTTVPFEATYEDDAPSDQTGTMNTLTINKDIKYEIGSQISLQAMRLIFTEGTSKGPSKHFHTSHAYCDLMVSNDDKILTSDFVLKAGTRLHFRQGQTITKRGPYMNHGIYSFYEGPQLICLSSTDAPDLSQVTLEQIKEALGNLATITIW